MDSRQARQDVVWLQHVAPQPTETALFGTLGEAAGLPPGSIEQVVSTGRTTVRPA